jgi:hypothetical protein
MTMHELVPTECPPKPPVRMSFCAMYGFRWDLDRFKCQDFSKYLNINYPCFASYILKADSQLTHFRVGKRAFILPILLLSWSVGIRRANRVLGVPARPVAVRFARLFQLHRGLHDDLTVRIGNLYVVFLEGIP